MPVTIIRGVDLAKVEKDLISKKKSDKMAVHYSAESIYWSTPQKFYDELNEEFRFTLDPCATPENAKCENYFTEEMNGLFQTWCDQIVFMNPPYGNPEHPCKKNCKKKKCKKRGHHIDYYIPGIKEWISKAHHEAFRNNAEVVCLIPSRTDTTWWHKYIDYLPKENVRHVKGRLSYGDGKNPAPFPSTVVIFNPEVCKDVEKIS